MKLVIVTLICWLTIPVVYSIDMLDCALGRVEDQLCPEDGGWSQWSAWGQCEGECGAVGRQMRSRNCSNPKPERNGADCDGNQLDIKQCSMPGCSLEQYEKLLAQDEVRSGQLAKLKQYSGSQSALLIKCLTSHCDLSDVSQALPNDQTKFWNSLVCVKKNTGCPAVGGWGDWSPWTRCNARCGSGQQMRCRACCDPPPSSSDVMCRGDPCEYQPCTGVDCGQPLQRVGDWSEWSDWSTCSSPCNFGLTRRSRVCQSPSRISSKQEISGLDALFDYSGSKDDSNADDYYDYGYYNDDGNKIVNNYEDNRYDDVNDVQSCKRGKRSKTCDKVEYYNNYEEDDLLSTSKPRKTTRKMERKPVGQSVKSEKTTGKDTWKFQKTDVYNSATKLETETETISSTVSLNLNSGRGISKSSYSTKGEKFVETVSQNNKVEKLSTEFKTKKITKEPIYMGSDSPTSGKDELIDTQRSTKQKQKEGDSIQDPILSDESEDENEMECTGELYKNSSTAAPCNRQKYFKDGKKSSSSTVPSSVLVSQSSSLGVLSSSQTLKSIDVTDIKTLISSKRNYGNLGTYSVEQSSSFPTSTETLSAVSTRTPSVSSTESVPSTFPAESVTSTFPAESVTSTFPAESVTSTSPTKKGFFGIFPKKTSTSPNGTVKEFPTPSTSQTTPSLETSEVLEAPQNVTEPNTSSNRQSKCDLTKKLELPSFRDSFPADGCSGPFEEMKPCNTQPCNNEDGGWSDWSSWSPCAPDCGLGWQTSLRSCTNPEPRSKESQCQGEATRQRSCYLQPCPVNLRTTKAVFMTGDSVVKYEALQQHMSVVLLYVRFRHFSPTGRVVSRRPHSCDHDRDCDHVTLSLYQSHVLVSVVEQKCYTDLMTTQRLSVGDWHEVLLTIVGAAVTLRLDDSILIQTFNLSCRPPSPNYDTDMKVGGMRFVGEVDRLTVNYKNYVFQKKREKRDIWISNDATVAPVESSQVQYEVNSKELPTISLSNFLQAPCFKNHSSWNLDLAIKPNFPDGMVLFIKGYDSRDFLFVSLEQSRIRMRVRVAAQGGECEHSEPVVPMSWLHLGLSRPPGGPVGLSVNGGPHCLVSLAPPTNDSEEPTIYCTGGILLGEMPLTIKTVLSLEPGHYEPTHSPFGLLGHLSVDNHTLDLTRLPRKISPDFVSKHPEHQYSLSSFTAATTVYYEEMLVLEGQRFSMNCIYNLSPDNVSDPNSAKELDINWYKLDVPVNTFFSNASTVHYETPTTGKAISLNITNYTSVEKVEGFYSCWLLYPLPLQSGLNIVTYGVIIVNRSQEKRTFLFWYMIGMFCLLIILVVVLVLWAIYEAYLDYKRGLGYYRCKKFNIDEAYEAMKSLIFSEKADKRLGGQEAASEAFDRYLKFLEQEAMAMENPTDTDVSSAFFPANEESYPPSDNKGYRLESGRRPSKKSSDSEVYYSIEDDPRLQKGGNNGLATVTVGVVDVECQSPFVNKMNYPTSRNESRVTTQSDKETEEEYDMVTQDNLIDVSRKWTQKEVSGQTSRETIETGIGQIQNTFAYRSIENELKFKPEKFKNLTKYVYSKQNKSDK